MALSRSPLQAAAIAHPTHPPNLLPPVSSDSTPTPVGRRLLRLLQPLIGLALLAFVAWLVPWTDELVVRTEGAPNIEVPGEIQGDWKGDAVGFAPKTNESSAELPAGLPVASDTVDLVRLEDGTWSTAGWEHPEGTSWELTPGMPRLLSTVDPMGMVWALLAFMLALMCGITRWWRLLRLAGCEVRWFDSFRLTFIGLFFNYVLPAGLTGGDLVKAVLAVRENPGKRADALVSVVVDRLLGLFALAVLATVVIFAKGETFAELRLPVAAVSLAMGGGGLLYVNRPLRRLVGFDALVSKLPLGQKFAELDRAVMLYSSKPMEMLLAFALSLGNHFGAISGVMALAVAFGVPLSEVGFWDYVAIVPVATMVSSLPVAPAGMGLGEAAFAWLFRQVLGQSAGLGVATSLGFRVCQLSLGLLGGLFLLKPGARKEIQAVREAESQSS